MSVDRKPKRIMRVIKALMILLGILLAVIVLRIWYVMAHAEFGR